MSTDRELLELAAMAAGIELLQFELEDGSFESAFRTQGGYWNPLTDDGDALRLAVKLRIDIIFFNGFQEVSAEHCSGNYPQCMEEYADDMNAATRRAIVRAAAEIGRNMP